MARVIFDHSRCSLARVTYVIGLFVLPLIAYSDYQNEHYASFVSKLITIGLVGLGLSFSFSEDKKVLSNKLAALILFAMTVVGALTKQDVISGVVWLPVLPILFLFLADLRCGMILTSLYLLVFVLGYLLHPYFHTTPRLEWHEWIQSVLAYLAATIFAVFYEHSRLSNEMVLRRQADCDHLTGVLNRRGITAFLNREVQRIGRYGGNLSIMLLDIDNFKSINDRYGHDVGDEILITLAAEIKTRMRKTDCFGRWGGEEFIVVLPSTELDGGLTIAETLRRVLPTLDFGRVDSITASFGVAEMRPGDSMEQVIQTADRALYLAKYRGKNRVCHLSTAELDDSQMEIPFEPPTA